MPQEALAYIASIESTDAIIINRVEDHPVAGLMNLETRNTNCSNLIVPLAFNGSPVGVVALVKNNRDAYIRLPPSFLAKREPIHSWQHQV